MSFKELAKSLHSLIGGTNTNEKLTTMLIRTFENFQNVLQLSRGLYLMQLSIADKSGFFDVPRIDILFKSIYDSKCRIFQHFSPMFGQAFANYLATIYTDPTDFAHAAANHFGDDLSEVLHFAYSAFPAMFGQFITEEQIEVAGKFLVEFIHNSKNNFAATELLSSFFKSATMFYYNFWNTLSVMIGALPTTIPKEQQNKNLKDVLHMTVPLLSRPHINALMAYVEKFPESAVNFFVVRLLKEPFLVVSKATSCFPNKEIVAQFSSFLDWIELEENSEIVIELFSEFITQSRRSTTLHTNDVFVSTPIQIVLCDADVKIIHEIALSYQHERFKYSTVRFDNSLDPFTLDIYLYNEKDQVQYTELEEIIGQQIPPEVAKNIEKIQNKSNRLWNIAMDMASKEEIPILDVIGRFKISEEERNDLLLRSIKESSSAMSDIGAILRLRRTTKDLAEIENALQFHVSAQFYSFATQCFREEMGNASMPFIVDRITHAMNLITRSYPAPPKAHFDLSCTAFDALLLERTPIAEQLDGEFKRVLSEWAASIKQFSLGRIAEAIPLLSDISGLPYGRRLVLILEFMKRFLSLYGDHVSELWTQQFRLTLYSASSDELLTTVLFLQHFVFPTQLFIENWAEETREAWILFVTGVFSVVGLSPDLLELCRNHVYCSNSFQIWARNAKAFCP